MLFIVTKEGDANTAEADQEEQEAPFEDPLAKEMEEKDEETPEQTVTSDAIITDSVPHTDSVSTPTKGANPGPKTPLSGSNMKSPIKVHTETLADVSAIVNAIENNKCLSLN